MSENATEQTPVQTLEQMDLVYDLASTPDGALLFAARSTGLYRSSDGGVTWEDAYATLEWEATPPTTSVALSPDFAHDHSLFAGVVGGVLHSEDGGETWIPVVLDSPPPAVSSLVLSPNFREDGVLLAGTTEDGVFRSADRGSRWVRWNFGLLDLQVYSLAISPHYAADETLYAGVETGLFRSTNGGRAWREVELPFGYDPVLSLALSPTYGAEAGSDAGTVFIGTETQGLWRSADLGKSWERLSEDVIQGAVNGMVLDHRFPDQAAVLILAGEALLLSRDGGQSWKPVTAQVENVMAILAPHGLEPGARIWVGQAGGKVAQLQL